VAKVSPVLVDVVAELTLYDGPDGAVIAAEAAARVNQLVSELNFIGYDLRRSSLINKLHVDGVLDVALISPAENVIIGTGQCAKINSITVTIAGRGQ
jgi:phage-related baseplate assembly protein